MTNKLAPTDLIHYHEPTQTVLMLPINKLMQLLTVYETVKKTITFAPSQMIVWLEFAASPPFPYIFSEDNAVTLCCKSFCL